MAASVVPACPPLYRERDFTQPRDKSIGSFGVCGPVEHQRIASLAMHLLNLADKHLSRVVQRLRHLLQNDSSHEGETLAVSSSESGGQPSIQPRNLTRTVND
jgi:hypothetical protein